MDSRALMSVVQLLMTRPSCDHIAQHLVLNLMPDHRARAAVISLFGHDGLLHAVGSFGVPQTPGFRSSWTFGGLMGPDS